MGIVASKGDTNTPLLNLCKERKELIRAAIDARYHLARSHLLYFKSLLNFSNALNQFVHKDLTVISYSSDDDSSSCDLICSGSDLDSDMDSVSDCLVCDRLDSDSQTAPLSNSDDQNSNSDDQNSSNDDQNSNNDDQNSNNDDKNQQKSESGDGTCGSSNNVQEVMEEPREGLGFFERELGSAPIEDEMRSLHDGFSGYDIFGLYGFEANTQCDVIEPEQRDDQFESDGLREIREREGIPELESETDHNSLIRKKKKKKNVQESPSVASEIDKSDTEANTCNGQVASETDTSNETCAQETETTPETDTKEETRSNEEASDEAYESTSTTFSESTGPGLTDLRNIVEKINCICEKAASYSEVSELLEVSRIVLHQPLGSQFKGFASRVLGSSGCSMRNSQPKRNLRADDLAGSFSMALEKLYMWEKKLYAEVTVEEKLRGSYDKAYKILKSLDEKGAESNEIYEAQTVVKLQLSKVNVSVRAVESISMRIHKIRDEELSVKVIEIINGFKKMWRFLAKCHHKQFQAIARSKSCVHIVEKGSSSRKATQKVEEQISRYRESLRDYIDAQRSFVKLLNEWLRRNIMEDDETPETEVPEIFRVCSEWLREIENVDEVKVLSAVEEMRLSFREIGLKQVEEEKQRMRTERLRKELERKTKELEEILGTAVVFPASESGPTANMIVGPELLSLKESVAQERVKHDKVIRELNDAVSMSLHECLVPVFEALEEFCFANFKACQNVRLVPRGALFLCQSKK